MSPTDTKRRLFICFSRLGKKVTKMCFSKGRILWRFVIKICLIKRSTEVIRTQWKYFLQDPRTERIILTLLLLNTTCPVLVNSVDPDQLASEESNWSESALFAIKYVNFYQKPGSSKWAWHLNVFSMTRVNKIVQPTNFHFAILQHIWAGAQHILQECVCTQRWDSTSAQSCQSFCYQP